VVATELRLADRLGAWKARWGIGRLSYLVPPGLYAVGEPAADDPVVVTANYKMSYDVVRRSLAGRSVWLLVLETHGINVWCAAGKGTFGTGELVRRVEQTGLERVVAHRTLVLPLLGAAGVRAVEVKKRTGFEVRFASVRAADLPAYLEGGRQATPGMRELSFSTGERLVLIPIEIVQGVLNSLPLLAVIFLATAFLSGTFSAGAGFLAVAGYLGALLAGAVVTPLLLPWLPTRSFTVKGAVVGSVWVLLFWALTGRDWGSLTLAAIFLILPAVSAFFALNFTGSTPFTSRSGVKREMRLALPVMALALVIGLVLLAAEVLR
jgi:acetyl-CoA decarbonylase/synthase complex subunit gamma